MGILDRLLGSRQEAKAPDHQEIFQRLGCQCEYYPASNDTWPAHLAYLLALRESTEKGGFTPVLLVLNEEMKSLPDTSSQERDRLLAASLPDGRKWLAEQLAEFKADIEKYEGIEYWHEEIVGEMTGGRALQMLVTGWQQNMVRSHPMLLVKVPTDKPWEIFAWLQFGGWNACPLPEEHMAVCKYWYEKYQAQPLVISADTIEYRLEEAIPPEDAMELAMEQCAFCSDIVLQGTGSIGNLADHLHRSRSWYFWWD